MKGRRAAEMEVEALNYWMTMRRLNAAYYEDHFEIDTGVVAECAQDLGDMLAVSEWPLLKHRCAEAIIPSHRIIGGVVA